MVDAMVATVACCAAWAIRVRLLEGTWPDLSTLHRWQVSVRESLLLLELPLLVMCMWAFGLYRPRRDRTLLAETMQLLKAVFISLVMLIVVLWGLGPRFVGDWLVMDAGTVGSFAVDAPRLQLATLMVLLPTMLVGHRVLFRVSLRAVRRRGWNLRHVLVIGSGRLGRIACRTLDRNSWTGLLVAAFLHHGEHAASRFFSPVFFPGP